MKPIAKKSFVKTSDKLFILLSVVIGLSMIQAVEMQGFTTINSPLINTVPATIGALFILLSFAMYWGIDLNQEIKYQELTKERKLRSLAAIEKKLLFRCRYKTHEKGSLWEISNANPFAWHNSRILIERSVDGHKETETIYLGTFKKAEKRILESKLEKQDRAKWRVLLLSLEGQMLDFPDLWKELEAHKIKF